MQAEKPYINRPFLQIFFECCKVYQRVYRKKNARAYRGRCPRCLRQVEFRIAPNGTNARAFAVY